MTKHWASWSIMVCSLLALPSILSASPAPRIADPCKQLRQTLDRQIDDVKDRQKDELTTCQQNYGRKSNECHSLKDQQNQELRVLRADRSSRTSGCNGRMVLNRTQALPAAAAGDYNVYPQEDDAYDRHHHHHHHHHHPYVHDASSNTANKATTPSGGKVLDKNALKDQGVARRGDAAPTSNHGSGHSSSSASSYSGSGGNHSSGGSGAYSGSSSGGSSHSSGGSSYSGSSYSGSASSGSSASQNSGGGRPK